jgi:shikimate dehydrogenase
MHNAALRTVGLNDWRYQLLPVPPALFAETVQALREAGFRGVNVTIPHKEAALALATSATERARAIGAANTLLLDDGEGIRADNTDAPALTGALPFPAAGRTALVLGAGGSARAAIWALKDAGARQVYVWNRTPERARALAAELDATATETAELDATATETAELDATATETAETAETAATATETAATATETAKSPKTAQILVNCTAVGLDAGDDPFKQLPITADGLRRYECVVDLVYTEPETRLVQAARAGAVPVVDGLELLVRQGALSFEQFTDRPAPVETMRAAVAAVGSR